jgi:3-oxoacyl-[acyl-carrier-protein] synthase-1
MGVISSLGIGVEENRLSLKQSKSGLRPMQYLDSVFQNQFYTGEVPYSTQDLQNKTRLFADKDYYRALYLAAIAIEELITQISIPKSKISIFSGTTTAGVTRTEQEYSAFSKNQTQPSVFLANMADCGSINRYLIEKFNFAPYNFTISTACSSASNAILLAVNKIRSGQIDFAICGGVDSLSRFTMNGFNSLKNMSAEPCKPFDRDRSGLNLGEAAAYLLLCKSDIADHLGLKKIATISGGGNANESYHMTGSDPRGTGALKSMERALARAGLSTSEIDHIHAHGTATTDNDIAEGNAIRSLFGEKAVFSSTKGLTGHTLAASGALNLIFSIIGIQENIIWGNQGFNNPDPDHGMIPVLENTKVDLKHIMVNSFGFGGNNTSIIISKA